MRTMTRSTLFSRNHPTLLLIKKRRSTDATGGLLSKICNIHKKTQVLKSLLNKVAGRKAPMQMFSCKYWEISKKAYFEEYLRTPASEKTLVSD